MANTLILYFSATGTTKKVAEKVAKKLNADIQRIHIPMKTLIGMMKQPVQLLSKSKSTMVVFQSKMTCHHLIIMTMW